MGSHIYSVDIKKTQPNAEFAEDYELGWVFLRSTLRRFAQPLETPVQEYLRGINSKSARTRFSQNNRPYTGQRFDY